ncbi:MAG TPA: HAMP domain-containing sensor histidine kinase, partial [Bacteroidales bacterium]|nr:HAMP domain-containing sensor histidine kinase [Bacteroidales bacterium]
INELKNKVNDLYNKALISENVKLSFLSNLSHEIRTPLNGLLGFLEIVSNLKIKNYTSVEGMGCEIIRKCADRFLLIMNDLIELSLISSGDEINITRENIRIEDILSELKDFFETSSLILDKKVSVSYINTDPCLTLFSDGKKIKHILYHLIDNAIKFSNDREVKFGYELENSNIVFFVSNNGVQISREESNKIFEAFYKQYTINDSFSEGFGIGLSLVKRLSELLGGEVDFSSSESTTTFFVRLPLK